MSLDIMHNINIFKDIFVARTQNLPYNNGSNGANICNKLFHPSTQIILIKRSDRLGKQRDHTYMACGGKTQHVTYFHHLHYK